MKAILVILAMVLAVPALAQDGDRPVLEVTFDETDAVPGQSLTLRLTVYVPTFMPTPPVWPNLEAPNLAIRLPERSTGPVSKPIGGETWSGVSRRYEISPMVPGQFRLPPQEILVTYNNPATSAPVKETLTTEPIALRGIVPEGAEGLDPFIAATGLTLEETIDGTPGAMTPGDSVTRTLTAKIEGTPSMFLPQLLPQATIAGVAAYPAEPVTMDTEARGAVTGTRTESVTYVAEGGGSGTAPAVRLDWYNLSSKAVETAFVDGFALSVDGPPVRTRDPRDPRFLVLAVVAALVAAGLAAFALRRLFPGLRRRWTRRRVARLASERYAYRRLKAAITRRDAADLYGALDTWAPRIGHPDPRRRADVEAALADLGAAHYRAGAAPAGEAWQALSHAIAAGRHDALRPPQSATLPPLNPATRPS